MHHFSVPDESAPRYPPKVKHALDTLHAALRRRASTHITAQELEEWDELLPVADLKSRFGFYFSSKKGSELWADRYRPEAAEVRSLLVSSVEPFNTDRSHIPNTACSRTV